LPAHHYPKVTTHIPDFGGDGFELETSYAYEREDVYSDVSRDEDYVNQRVDELNAARASRSAKGKTIRADFALWKGAKPGELAGIATARVDCWWHRMSGDGVGNWAKDLYIYGGGAVELVFRIRKQTRGSTVSGRGAQGAWWHCGRTAGGAKMSKSLGNFCPQLAIFEASRPKCVANAVL